MKRFGKKKAPPPQGAGIDLGTAVAELNTDELKKAAKQVPPPPPRTPCRRGRASPLCSEPYCPPCRPKRRPRRRGRKSLGT